MHSTQPTFATPHSMCFKLDPSDLGPTNIVNVWPGVQSNGVPNKQLIYYCSKHLKIQQIKTNSKQKHSKKKLMPSGSCHDFSKTLKNTTRQRFPYLIHLRLYRANLFNTLLPTMKDIPNRSRRPNRYRFLPHDGVLLSISKQKSDPLHREQRYKLDRSVWVPHSSTCHRHGFNHVTTPPLLDRCLQQQQSITCSN